MPHLLAAGRFLVPLLLSCAGFCAAPAGAHPGSKDPALRARMVAAFAYAGHALADMAAVMWRMLRIPSFAIIMIEHVIGNLQSVFGYKIIYFQARGSHPLQLRHG